MENFLSSPLRQLGRLSGPQDLSLILNEEFDADECKWIHANANECKWVHMRAKWEICLILPAYRVFVDKMKIFKKKCPSVTGKDEFEQKDKWLMFEECSLKVTRQLAFNWFRRDSEEVIPHKRTSCEKNWQLNWCIEGKVTNRGETNGISSSL